MIHYYTDGSPAGSTLIKGDGSGDSANDATREAVYGDDDVGNIRKLRNANFMRELLT